MSLKRPHASWDYEDHNPYVSEISLPVDLPALKENALCR